MITEPLTDIAIQINKAILICTQQMDWWRVAPSYGLDHVVCQEEALKAELALIDLIDSFYA